MTSTSIHNPHIVNTGDQRFALEMLLREKIAEMCPGGVWHGNYYTRFVSGFYRSAVRVRPAAAPPNHCTATTFFLCVPTMEAEDPFDFWEPITWPHQLASGENAIMGALDLRRLNTNQPFHEVCRSKLLDFWSRFSTPEGCATFLWQKATARPAVTLTRYHAAVASTIFHRRWDRWDDLLRLSEWTLDEMIESDPWWRERAFRLIRAYESDGETGAIAELNSQYLERLNALRYISHEQYVNGIADFRAHLGIAGR